MPTFDWIGKKAVVNHHQEVPYHLLRDVPELGCGPADAAIKANGKACTVVTP